jgi:MFS family permease
MADNEIKDPDGFQVGGPKATYVLIVCSLLYMVNYMDRQVLSVVLEPMKLDLGLSDSEAGALQTIFLLSMGLFAMPISYFVDRWSRSKMIGLMAIVWSAATFVTGLGRNFVGVLIPRFITGVGEAGFSSGGTALITASYPEEDRSKKLGTFNFFLVLGAGLGGLMGGYLSKNFGGWRTPFFVFAVPGIILGIMAFFMQDYKSRSDEDAAEKINFIRNAKALLSVPTLRWMYFGYAMHIIMSFSLLHWSTALIMRRFEIGEDKAAVIFTIGGIFAGFGPFIGGHLADAWQKRHPAGRMRFAASIQALGSICILTALISICMLHEGGYDKISVWLVVGFIAYSVYNMCAIGGIPAVGTVSQSVVTPELKGMAWGMAMFFMYIGGGAWGPYLTGWLSARFGEGTLGLTHALMITGSFGFVAFVLWWIASTHYEEDFKKAQEASARITEGGENYHDGK